jgi:hypothetical protein
MTTSKMQNTGSEQLQERFGRAVGRRLSAGTAELPYHVAERLRAARVQAVARRKLEAVAPAMIANGGNSGALTFGGFSLWRQIASALPLVVLVGGLIVIHSVQNDQRATEVAEIDAQLLTDDLPPAAYADPGFVQFLKSSH